MKVNAREVDLGDVVRGLGRVQTITQGGERAGRTLTLIGEWGWRLSLPIGMGLCEVDLERRRGEQS